MCNTAALLISSVISREVNVKPALRALSLPLAALPAPVKTHQPPRPAFVGPRDARDAQPPFKLHRKPSIGPLQKLKNPINYGGATIIARGRAATTAAASAAASRAGATAVVMVARTGDSNIQDHRDCVAAAAGCGASATRGPAAATAARGSRRTPGSARRRARRALGAASRDRPTGTTSGACGPPGSSSARRAAGRRCRTFSGSVLVVVLKEQVPRRPWAAASASSCAGRPCLGVKQGGSFVEPQARAARVPRGRGCPGSLKWMLSCFQTWGRVPQCPERVAWLDSEPAPGSHSVFVS